MVKPRHRLVLAGTIQLTVAVVASLVGGGRVDLPTVLVFAAMFAAAGLVHIEVDLPRGRCTITPSQAVLVVAFACLPPGGTALAAASGEVCSLVARRVAGYKVVYNACGRAAAAALAGTVVVTFGTEGSGVDSWPARLVGAGLFSVSSLLSTSFALAAAEQRTLVRVLTGAAPAALLAASIAAPVGLIAHKLAADAVLAPMVLLPVVAVYAVNVRAAARGRVEHERLSQLYVAMREATPLRSADEAASVAAARSRELLIATGAAVLWRMPDEPCRIATVGEVPLVDPDATMREVVTVVRPGATSTVGLPGGGGPAIVSRAMSGAVDVVLLVWRRAELERTSLPAAPAAEALAGIAALALQNSHLLAEVERALAVEMHLSRKKDEFVATVSHELRTPLAVLTGFVETVHEHAEVLDFDQQRSFLGKALEQGRRLERLITDLLDLAAAARGDVAVDLTATDTSELVEAIRQAVCVMDDGRVEVIEPTVRRSLRTDRDKALRVLENLVGNALKYSTGRVRLEVIAVDGSVLFAVDDEGPGIAPEDRDRVFEPFVQLDQSATRSHGGAGLGLHLCRQLSAALGGSLRLDDSRLGGARFVFCLPSADPPAVEDTHSRALVHS